MKPEEVKEYYKSQYNFRKLTGMSASTLANWLRWGFIPEDAQYKLERITKGELKVSGVVKMNEEEQNIHDAKNILKQHIKFCESLLKHLSGNDELNKGRALWTSWCLNRYLSEVFAKDIEEAMKQHGGSSLNE